MVKIKTFMRENFERSIDAKRAFLDNQNAQDVFCAAAEMVLERYRAGGRMYIFGNGGSAADAQHLAAEFVSKLARDREPLPAEALTVDSSIITAIGNDYGYDEVFARQLRGKATPKDVALAISTSGNSKNILRGLETCKTLDIPSVLFTGRDGGKAVTLSDYCVIAPGQDTATIQELHIVFAHILCGYVEHHIFQE